MDRGKSLLMKDNYLFRGRNPVSGEWVYWYFFQPTEIAVDANTVTQCLGIRDSQGMLVFDGDLVVCPGSVLDNGVCGEIDYYTDFPSYCITLHKYREEPGQTEEIGETYDFAAIDMDLRKLQVIGNVFDDEDMILEE